MTKHKDEVKGCIAKSMGITINQVTLKDVVVHLDGKLEVQLEIPSSVTIPHNLRVVATDLIQHIEGLKSASPMTSKS